MNDLQNVRHSMLITLRRAALLLFACVAIGALVGWTFGLLSGGLNDLLHWKFDKIITWGIGFALAGAATGAILGVFAMTDRLMNAPYWEDRSPRVRERDRAGARPATAHESRVVGLDGHSDVSSDISPARDSASRDGYLW